MRGPFVLSVTPLRRRLPAYVHELTADPHDGHDDTMLTMNVLQVVVIVAIVSSCHRVDRPSARFRQTHHSFNPASGLILDARQAGMTQAAMALPIATAATVPSAIGSPGDTPYRRLAT